MVVEGDIFKFEFFFVAVLVDECGVQLSLVPQAEAVHLDLLGKIHMVRRDSLEYGFLCAPVDGKLLILLLVVQVVDLILRQSLLLDL